MGGWLQYNGDNLLELNCHIWSDKSLKCSLMLMALLFFYVNGFLLILQYGCSLGCLGDTTEVSVDTMTGL